MPNGGLTQLESDNRYPATVPVAGGLNQLDPNLRFVAARQAAQTMPTRSQLLEMQQRALQMQREAAERYAQAIEAPIDWGYDPEMVVAGQGIMTGEPGAGLAGLADIRGKLAAMRRNQAVQAAQVRAQAEREEAEALLGGGRLGVAGRPAWKAEYKNVGGRIVAFIQDPLTGQITQEDKGPAGDTKALLNTIYKSVREEAQEIRKADGSALSPSELSDYINRRVNEEAANMGIRTPGESLETAAKGAIPAAGIATTQLPGGLPPETVTPPSEAIQKYIVTPEVQVGLKEQEKKAAEWKDEVSKDADSALAASSLASTGKQLLTQLERLTPEERKNTLHELSTTPGPLSPYVMSIANTLTQLGVVPKDGRIAKGNATMGELESVLKGISITKIAAFKGNFSEKDRDYVDRMTGAITDPTEKLRFNLDMAQIMAQRAQEKSAFAQAWADDPKHAGSLRGAADAWRKYISETPSVVLVQGKPLSIYQYREAYAKKAGRPVEEIKAKADEDWRKLVKQRAE